MKDNAFRWIVSLAAGAALCCSAAEERLFPKVNIWYTWKNTGNRGKIVKNAPTGAHPQGEIIFLADPGKGQYSCCAYGNEDISLDKAYRLTVTIRISPEVNPDATVSLTLGAKKAGGVWFNDVWSKTVKPSPAAKIAIVPGTEQTASVEVDLAQYPKLAGMVCLCPYVSVKNLKSGDIRVVRFEMNSRPGKKPDPPKAKVPGMSGMTARTDALKQFAFPTKINWDNFQRQMDCTPIGLHIVPLESSMKRAAVQWPDGTVLEARYENGSWQILAGKQGDMRSCTVIPGEKIEMGFYGMGAVFRGSDGKYQLVEGGLSVIDATLMLPPEVKTPAIRQHYIGRAGLLYCYAEEAESSLDGAVRLFRDNHDTIKAHWRSAGMEWTWGTHISFYQRNLKKMKDLAVAESEGFLPAIAADPILRDRYNWLVWMVNGQYSYTGYFGGELGNEFFNWYAGRGEIIGALLFAQRLEGAVSRARRVSGASFREGASVPDLLCGGWASALADVPQNAGLPVLRKDYTLRAALGETESVLLVLASAQKPLQNVSVEIKAESPDAPSAQLFRVQYIQLEASGSPQLPLTRGADTPVADVCIPFAADEKLSIPPYQNQPVQVSISVPEKTAPGSYSYLCTVRTENGQFSLPLKLQVEDVKPGFGRLASIGGLYNEDLNGWYPENLRKKARQNLSLELLKHHIAPIDLYQWGVFSPGPEDLDFCMEHGLDGALLSAGLQGLVSPDAELARCIVLYGSRDGQKFEKLVSSTQLVPRKTDTVDEYDLVVTPKQSTAEYRFLKVHCSRKLQSSQYCQTFVLRKEYGMLLELTSADGKKTVLNDNVRAILSDKDPENGSFEKAKVISSNLIYDQASGQEIMNSILAETGGTDVKSIRLENHRASVLAKNCLNNYRFLRRKAGGKLIVYMYGFDEANEKENAHLLQAMIRAKKLFPGIRIMTTACNLKANPELYKVLDIHCPGNAYSLTRWEREVHKKYGTEFWTYVGGGGYYPFGNFERVDQPRITSRAFFWSMVAFDHISGFLYWDINMWRMRKELRDRVPFDWSCWDPSHGDYNGMQALFYPGPDGAIYPSLRAGAMRDGIEDVNMFRYAGELLKQHPYDAAAQELKAIGDGFARSMSVWCKDPVKMEQYRGRLFDLILKLKK